MERTKHTAQLMYRWWEKQAYFYEWFSVIGEEHMQSNFFKFLLYCDLDHKRLNFLERGF